MATIKKSTIKTIKKAQWGSTTSGKCDVTRSRDRDERENERLMRRDERIGNREIRRAEREVKRDERREAREAKKEAKYDRQNNLPEQKNGGKISKKKPVVKSAVKKISKTSKNKK